MNLTNPLVDEFCKKQLFANFWAYSDACILLSKQSTIESTSILFDDSTPVRGEIQLVVGFVEEFPDNGTDFF